MLAGQSEERLQLKTLHQLDNLQSKRGIHYLIDHLIFHSSILDLGRIPGHLSIRHATSKRIGETRVSRRTASDS